MQKFIYLILPLMVFGAVRCGKTQNAAVNSDTAATDGSSKVLTVGEYALQTEKGSSEEVAAVINGIEVSAEQLRNPEALADVVRQALQSDSSNQSKILGLSDEVVTGFVLLILDYFGIETGSDSSSADNSSADDSTGSDSEDDTSSDSGVSLSEVVGLVVGVISLFL